MRVCEIELYLAKLPQPNPSQKDTVNSRTTYGLSFSGTCDCLPCQAQYDGVWKKEDIWRKDEHNKFNVEEMNKKVGAGR